MRVHCDLIDLIVRKCKLTRSARLHCIQLQKIKENEINAKYLSQVEEITKNQFKVNQESEELVQRSEKGKGIFTVLYDRGMKIVEDKKKPYQSPYTHKPKIPEPSERLANNVSREERDKRVAVELKELQKSLDSPFKPTISEESEKIIAENPNYDYMRRERASVQVWMEKKQIADADNTHV